MWAAVRESFSEGCRLKRGSPTSRDQAAQEEVSSGPASEEAS